MFVISRNSLFFFTFKIKKINDSLFKQCHSVCLNHDAYAETNSKSSQDKAIGVRTGK